MQHGLQQSVCVKIHATLAEEDRIEQLIGGQLAEGPAFQKRADQVVGVRQGVGAQMCLDDVASVRPVRADRAGRSV